MKSCDNCRFENKSITEDPCYSCEVASRDNWEPKGVPIKVDQSAKHDEGKPRLSLVPPSLIEAVGAISDYHEIDFIGEVVFQDCSFAIKGDAFTMYDWPSYEIEVLGNVYENIELLEVEDEN